MHVGIGLHHWVLCLVSLVQCHLRTLTPSLTPGDDEFSNPIPHDVGPSHRCHGEFWSGCQCQSMTLCIELCAFPMHLQSSSAYSDTLHTGLHMLCNPTPPPASVPLHMLPLLVCLFVSLSRLFPLIDGQWTSAKSDCTCSIRRGLSRRLRSSLLLNSSPSTSRDHPLVA